MRRDPHRMQFMPAATVDVAMADPDDRADAARSGNGDVADDEIFYPDFAPYRADPRAGDEAHRVCTKRMIGVP